jgi:hypothetical protein
MVQPDGTRRGWAEAIDQYFAEYDRKGIGPDARNSALLHLDTAEPVLRVRQVLEDPASDRDWGISAEMDLAASDEAGEPVVTVTAGGPSAERLGGDSWALEPAHAAVCIHAAESLSHARVRRAGPPEPQTTSETVRKR